MLEEYQKQVELKHYQKDKAQQAAVEQLHLLQLELSEHVKQSAHWLNRLKDFMGIKRPKPLGLYIWGDVGRGKTWLMDMFYDTLDPEPFNNKQKLRLHFHHFMQAIHDQLSLIGEHRHPLKHIARSLARRHLVICLDEFHVSDITDAMLLYGLLDELFKQGVVLLATSNIPPDNLYKNGLQRNRFLPAIDLIKRFTTTFKLDGQQDHRLRLLEKADTWYIANEKNNQLLQQRFEELASSHIQSDLKVTINHRQILSRFHTQDMLWFEFNIICGYQRSSSDYIEIARQYHSVFISNIPQLNDSDNDKARRFINLIDEFYDRNVNILISAETEPALLYQGQLLAFEFRRTQSRLEEMRSHEYLERSHMSS